MGGFFLKKLNKWKMGSSVSFDSHAALERLVDNKEMNMVWKMLEGISKYQLV
jgi:hypothetical protein